MLVLCSSCIKEKITTYKAFVKNGSNQTIRVFIFAGGRSTAVDSILLNTNAEFLLGQGFDRGITNRSGFSSKYSGEDSIVVVFNNNLRVAHYFTTPAAKSPRFYLYTSNRNMLQLDSYRYEYEDISKHQRKATYTYEFTEDDYRFAQ